MGSGRSRRALNAKPNLPQWPEPTAGGSAGPGRAEAAAARPGSAVERRPAGGLRQGDKLTK